MDRVADRLQKGKAKASCSRRGALIVLSDRMPAVVSLREVSTKYAHTIDDAPFWRGEIFLARG